jgi:anti-anti-sigma regulatory factor
MTLAAVPAPPTAPTGIHPVLADRSRAVVQVGHDLDGAGVGALERVIEEHCAAGRCFLRISLVGVHRLSAAFVALLERTHYRLLARRGTSIITGAGEEVMATLRELGLDEVLLVVEACAHENATAPR